MTSSVGRLDRRHNSNFHLAVSGSSSSTGSGFVQPLGRGIRTEAAADHSVGMDETSRLFQCLADRLGWSKYDDLDVLEMELQQKIDESKKQQDPCEYITKSTESQNTCDSCVCKLLPSSSEDEVESCSKVTLNNRQKKHGKCVATRKIVEYPQINSGSEAVSDSSDDIFELSLTHKKILNSDFTVKGAPRLQNKRSDNTLLLSTDSSGDEDFEKFLTLVKKPYLKSQKYRSSKKNDNCLQDFIVSDSSLDELDIKAIMDSERNADSELHEPARTFTRAQICSTYPRARTTSMSNSSADFRIKNTQRSPTPEERTNKSELPISPTWVKKPLRSNGNSLYYSVHSRRLTQISNSSDASSDEFESLIERIKCKTSAATSSKLNEKRMAVTEPVKQKTRSRIRGIKHKPEDKSVVPVFVQTTNPKKSVPSDSSSVSHIPDFKPSSLSKPQSQCGVRRLCTTPGCFLQDLLLSSSKYVKKFKENREELTQELYDLYNKTVFQQKLPKKLEITWNKKMRKTAGYCVTGQKRDDALQRYARIELSEKVCDSAERLRDTLIHELCHAATWLINNVRDGHGPIWKFYAQKSILIHPELPIVKRCHTYEINYKYNYQCSRCKTMIGRHSKSLDTQRVVCAICLGPLELLNSMKYSTPAKRQLAPFAQFVKENYSSTKKENKGLKHAEVMQKLSVDFGKKAQI
ncbi:germ cell nuclear acidic protein [Narcine bancroftii]|uniref:germ cell nuclear acidic protein n=1 Tax=Narcine bancroftii TaxID=1343680 RepID=UPI0038315AF0